MITQVSVSKFRVIAEAKADLSPMTLLVGPNGSGKSTFLWLLKDAAQYFSMPQIISFPDETSFRIDSSSGDFHATVQKERNEKATSLRTVLKEQDSPEIIASIGVNAFPEVALYLQFEMSGLRTARYSSDNAVEFATNGSNLSRVIAEYRLNDLPALDRIRQNLAMVVPSITDVKVRLRDGVFSLLFDTAAAKDIEAAFMSDGTLFALGIITALSHVAGKRALVLIDDIDQGLHPLAQRELVGLLRKFQETNPDTQIIASTHSPYLLACVKPEEVLCMHLGEDGLSRMAPLTDHPDFERWKDEMNPGEFWSLFGDEWVTKKANA